jgi:UDP-N-acetylglucosamine diphosphorylase/glucosamine-1-phosphate N-acetyltransferase
MNYILFDDDRRTALLPLTYTRPLADMRVGILTIREKWEFQLKAKTSSLTQQYLSKKFPTLIENDNILINGTILPNDSLIDKIHQLNTGEKLLKENILIAYRISGEELGNGPDAGSPKTVSTSVDFLKIENTWDIFSKNGLALKEDFNLLTKGRKSAKLPTNNFIQGRVEDIFIEEGADVEYAYLNSESGPIYIGKNAVVMEGSKIRGPFALCDHAQLKMDAKVYGATTIGPYCKVGGEINESVFFGYSNKAHDGFLGHAVIGEWVNIGADTNNSNLKNTYDHVKLWSYEKGRFVSTGLQFCGLIMGDHSKTGINSMFNTGTVVGVSCNLFGAGFQRNFIPSFSWGGPLKMTTFDLQKSFDVAKAVMSRRGINFSKQDEEILTFIYNLTINPE